MSDFRFTRRQLPSAGALTTIDVKVASGALSPDDDLFTLRGGKDLIQHLINDPPATIIATLGEDTRAEGKEEVTILFSYPEVQASEGEADSIEYIVEGVKRTNVLTVRAIRRTTDTTDFTSIFAKAPDDPPDVLHIKQIEGTNLVFAHFHLGVNDLNMRHRVAAIALDPDGYLSFVNSAPQVERLRNAISAEFEDVPIADDRVLKFALPNSNPESLLLGASSELPLRELRYLFQWMPEPLAASTSCTCNKTRGSIDPNTGQVIVDTFITTTYSPCDH